jgi:hypothetical protein
MERYVRFKAHIARHGVTGEQAIIAAIGLLLRSAERAVTRRFL